MKSKRTNVLIFLLMTMNLLPAFAIQIEDYTFPDSSFSEAFIGGQFNSKTGNQDQMSYDVLLQGNYDYSNTSLAKNFFINLNGKTDSSKGPNSGDKSVENTIIDLDLRYDKYLKPTSKFFFYGAGDTTYDSNQKELFAKIGAGAGYGRVINATPLAKAIRIAEELMEHSILSSMPSDDQLVKLAQVIDNENQYRSNFGAEEYEPKWYEAMEKELAGSLAKNGLGAAGALHIQRVLIDEPISVRKHGWFVRSGLGYIINQFNGSDSDVTLDVEFNYAKPFGLKTQFENTFNFSKILGDEGYFASNLMTLTYEISDRVDWENSLNLSLIKPASSKSNWTNVLGTTFRYYLTNKLNLEASLTATQFADGVDNNGNDDIELATLFGINYRLK